MKRIRKTVTHVAGLFCYPCRRSGPGRASRKRKVRRVHHSVGLARTTRRSQRRHPHATNSSQQRAARPGVIGADAAGRDGKRRELRSKPPPLPPPKRPQGNGKPRKISMSQILLDSCFIIAITTRIDGSSEVTQPKIDVADDDAHQHEAERVFRIGDEAEGDAVPLGDSGDG
jgi:hypothetical protein